MHTNISEAIYLPISALPDQSFGPVVDETLLNSTLDDAVEIASEDFITGFWCIETRGGKPVAVHDATEEVANAWWKKHCSAETHYNPPAIPDFVLEHCDAACDFHCERQHAEDPSLHAADMAEYRYGI